MSKNSTISIKSPEEIRILREGGKILYEILHKTAEKVKPGVSTGELNEYAERLLAERGVEGPFKGYHGFPSALCTSVNEACVHGIPSFEYFLKEGDLVGLDFGVKYQGLITDSAITVQVGQISLELQHLLKTTKQSLDVGIRQAVVGNHVGAIGSTIQKFVERQGYGVVRELIGHGVGYEVHEAPEVPNFGNKNDGPVLQEGMVIAIEPIVNVGDWRVKSLKDKWTMVSVDGSISAHFEHSVAITADGPLVLTEE
ncbi:MAG: type I methionyl aminopeptidase [Candidatus Gracilibacteria bacterium]|nr:type I methionyl aminopeptidase [bacterium]MDZ4217319.1 type I methionyl aminopeptidase [Candidatus Gracilibacteria bacterium]